MKKIFTLLCVAAMAGSASAELFTSPGNGTTYTLEMLSQIPDCQVSKVDGAWVLDTTFVISEGDVLKIQNNEVVKMADKVQISVNGTLDCAPADTATITSTSAEATPKGFKLFSDNAKAVLKNTLFEYVGITISAANGYIVAENCTFDKYNYANATGGTINYGKTGKGNVFNRCNFTAGASAAIATGANTPVGITITNCYFYANNYKNSNRPQINLTAYGENDVIIDGNVVIGGHYTKVGGIAVNNMLGSGFSNKVVIKNNVVKENRYGITMTGSLNLDIIDNEIIDNIYETVANNGGSAISLYDSAGKGKVFVKGNYMKNNLWGITIIGGPEVNCGKVEDVNADDYNPGENIFIDCGNGGVLYDLYNNGPKTVYAQGNIWNVAVQDSASIEVNVFHKVDNPDLGEVIFMPAGKEEPSSVTDVQTTAPVASIRYFNAMGRESAEPFEGINIMVIRHTDGTIRTVKELR
ncbi:MAG: hypothetical protein Q4B68_04510 [Bacteroidales bacterium]|nr:hypothetical protein [Bacteroidales bacterium]